MKQSFTALIMSFVMLTTPGMAGANSQTSLPTIDIQHEVQLIEALFVASGTEDKKVALATIEDAFLVYNQIIPQNDESFEQRLLLAIEEIGLSDTRYSQDIATTLGGIKSQLQTLSESELADANAIAKIVRSEMKNHMRHIPQPTGAAFVVADQTALLVIILGLAAGYFVADAVRKSQGSIGGFVLGAATAGVVMYLFGIPGDL